MEKRKDGAMIHDHREMETLSPIPEHIAAALQVFQAKMKSPKKDTTGQDGNRQFRYADLASIAEATQEALAEAGLSVLTPAWTEDDTVVVCTILLHKSGEQWTTPAMRWMFPDNIKHFGGLITYLRRYSLSAALNLAPAEDVDSLPDYRDSEKIQPIQARQTSAPSRVVAHSNPAGNSVSGRFDFAKSWRYIAALKEQVPSEFFESVMTAYGYKTISKINSQESAIQIQSYLERAVKNLQTPEGEADPSGILDSLLGSLPTRDGEARQ